MKKAGIFCRLLLLGVIFLTLLVLTGCGVGVVGGDVGDGGDVVSNYDYTTTVTPVASQDVNASSGGVVEVTTSTSPLKGLKLTIPSGALPTNTTVKIGQVNNPPELPSGLNYIGAPINLGPDILFNSPLTIEIPYHDEHLSDAGISDDIALELYYYDESTGEWEEVTIISIDTANNKIIAQITHFSYYAVTGLNGTPPEDLGTPQQGDLLYKTGSIFGETQATGWRPGHVGIYTGEKTYPGKGLASDDVKEYGRYNVVEALWGGVQYSYYDIPNVIETYQSSLIGFNRSDIYMGAREPANSTLTSEDREKIVTFAESKIDRPYVQLETLPGVLFGMLAGSLVKGPNKFNCVGLAEAAYEAAGVNLVTWWQEEIGVGLPPALTPAEQYNATKPAGGINPLPKIEWATLTPNSGTECTSVLAQISVSHTYGLSYIDSVIYVTDDGYTNPELYINDEGLQGDISPGDGIYSVQAYAGGDASMGQAGINFTVTDKLGKTATIRLLYTFTGTCQQSVKASEVKREMLPRFFY